MSDERFEIVIVLFCQMFAEMAAFHLKPSSFQEWLMEGIRVIAIDSNKCPDGEHGWKQNRNLIGHDLRENVDHKRFNKTLRCWLKPKDA